MQKYNIEIGVDIKRRDKRITVCAHFVRRGYTAQEAFAKAKLKAIKYQRQKILPCGELQFIDAWEIDD